MLSRLIYRSASKSPNEDDVADILAASRRNNADLGITGALCHYRGSYMQYLEGDEVAIECLMATIVEDARHCALVILEFRLIAARAFPNWSMGMLNSDAEILEILAPLRDMGLYGIPQSSAAPMIRAMSQSTQWLRAAQ